MLFLNNDSIKKKQYILLIFFLFEISKILDKLLAFLKYLPSKK